jgi:ankyrin repeat protein
MLAAAFAATLAATLAAVVSSGATAPLAAQQSPGVTATAPAPGAQEQLWDAAKAGDTVAVAAALARGAAIDSLDLRRSPNGRRALNWAAWYDRPAAVEFLVRRGATVNAENLTGFTPLHHAAENGSYDAASALLRLGADPIAVNGVGERPADVARTRGHERIALLIEAAKH